MVCKRLQLNGSATKAYDSLLPDYLIDTSLCDGSDNIIDIGILYTISILERFAPAVTHQYSR
jgi:hypothetical protein